MKIHCKKGAVIFLFIGQEDAGIGGRVSQITNDELVLIEQCKIEIGQNQVKPYVTVDGPQEYHIDKNSILGWCYCYLDNIYGRTKDDKNGIKSHWDKDNLCKGSGEFIE